jgi:glyoxylase-like metal-dependent hydrolase (beta-lactamase superfamily II)
MQIGNTEVHVVSDGEFRSDGGGVFGLVPRVLWERYVEVDAQHQVALALNCLLIMSQGHRILVDAGYGDKLSPQRVGRCKLKRDVGLIGGLARWGVQPEDIDVVVNTHLHADHSGWNTVIRDGVLCPTFPNAEYWVQRIEWEEAQSPNERTRATYLPENLTPIRDQLHLLDGDAAVTSEVRCVVSRGHTRAHQSVIIESQGQYAIYMGEVAPLALGLERLAWIAAFDVEPLESLETRRRLREWAYEHDAVAFFNHDVRCAAGRLRREGERYFVDVLAID